MKLVRETISALAKVQDTFFGDLVQELNLSETNNAVDWLFDYCYNENGSKPIEYYVEHINKAMKEDGTSEII